MSWTERDGPVVLAPTRRGLGTIVKETMAERSVDGAVDLDCAAPALSWRLTCRAANALDPTLGQKMSLLAVIGGLCGAGSTPNCGTGRCVLTIWRPRDRVCWPSR
jgi:hypothetical protein